MGERRENEDGTMWATSRLRWASSALAISNLVGMIVAIRRHVVPRPLGLRSPVRGWAEPVLWGTGLSAPIPMIVALGAAGWRGNRTVVGVLAVINLIGQLAEPIAWQRDRRRTVLAVVVANLVLSTVTLAAAWHSGRGHHRGHDGHPGPE
jgi:hypothetical protein